MAAPPRRALVGNRNGLHPRPDHDPRRYAEVVTGGFKSTRRYAVTLQSPNEVASVRGPAADLIGRVN
jgi:hypothetical protein